MGSGLLEHYFVTHYAETCFEPQFLNFTINTIHNKAKHLSFPLSAFLWDKTLA
jgi:hypothetical protein